MSDEVYFDQQARIAAAKEAVLKVMPKVGEHDHAIWIAALVDILKRVSDWNLEGKLGKRKRKVKP